VGASVWRKGDRDDIPRRWNRRRPKSKDGRKLRRYNIRGNERLSPYLLGWETSRARLCTMTSVKAYWRELSEEILDYIRFLKLKPVDIYLVGSGVTKSEESLASINDVNSIVLLEDKLSLDSLREVKLQIDKYLHCIDDAGLYHFKLFNEEELKRLGIYDGFRLFELQSNNVSMLGTKSLMYYNPMLNGRNFCNSIFIQIVYEFLNSESSRSLIDVLNNKKVMERIERNKHILRITGKHNLLSLFKDAIAFCKNNDDLFAFFWHIASGNTLSCKSMYWFIEQYFKRFRHEYINKYYTYINAIKQKCV
jgi:hypothetical protein